LIAGIAARTYWEDKIVIVIVIGAVVAYTMRRKGDRRRRIDVGLGYIHDGINCYF
jgi:hypothetical protein